MSKRSYTKEANRSYTSELPSERELRTSEYEMHEVDGKWFVYLEAPRQRGVVKSKQRDSASETKPREIPASTPPKLARGDQAHWKEDVDYAIALGRLAAPPKPNKTPHFDDRASGTFVRATSAQMQHLYGGHNPHVGAWATRVGGGEYFTPPDSCPQGCP